MAELKPLVEDMRRRRPPLGEEEIRERLIGIGRMVFLIVGLCPLCQEPVRACDSRRRVDDDLAHVPCLEGR